jgi:superfamily I DNA/RNA helicase
VAREKGELKKDVLKKIESLERTREVVKFYELYEVEKRDRGLMDYDDVLEYAVRLVEESDDVRADMRENFLYVLVDEHQDSSGVQNSFLRAVWQDTDKPNIFVVGDDRQLIYGFGGASLSYFEDFKTLFGRAELITLVENYRSTAPILTLADELLASELTTEKLRSNTSEAYDLFLSEYSYPRDEVIAAGLHFKKLIESGLPANKCALLVPKNRHVRGALTILRDLGVPVSSGTVTSLFEARDVDAFRRALAVVADPNDATSLARTLFDRTSGISPMEAHTYLRPQKNYDLSIADLVKVGSDAGLFAGENTIARWGTTLTKWVELSQKESLTALIGTIGNELLIDRAESHDEILSRAEILRTFLHLALMREESHPHETLADFILYLNRLESYGTHIPLATFGASSGVTVMTLHASKGLEWDSVWIAHMNEETLMSSKRGGFTLPERVEARVEARDSAVARREVYVAITRAKKYCTISYSAHDYKGADMTLASVLHDIPLAHMTRRTAEETEAELLAYGDRVYVEKTPLPVGDDLADAQEFVKNEYEKTRVSVSLLNNFFECPWKWYFRNFLQLPELKSDALALGSAVHSAIEMILKDETMATKEAITTCVSESLYREGLADKRTLAKLTADGVATTLRWVSEGLPGVERNHESERALSYRDPRFTHLQLFGKIDLTERYPDGALAVTDFKTGSSKTQGMIEKLDEENRLSSYMRQLAMYSYLILGNEKNRDIVASRLYFLEADAGDKNMIYQTRIGEEHIDLLVRDIRDYDSAMKTGEWVSRPCYFKPYGSGSSECEHCALAKAVYKKITLH